MKERAGGFGFWAVTMLLIFVTALCCAGTAFGGERSDARERQERCRAREEELVSAAREFLRAEGLENSGVMLTRVVGEDEVRHYTLTVHHRGIDRMCGQEREELMAGLAAYTAAYCDFGETECDILHKFLIDN